MNTDLLIIGGGPTGLSAAINAASEGLSVRLLDSGTHLGGQAKESHGIENYPGFPEGITGSELMRRLVTQAGKFDTNFVCPATVQHIVKHEDTFGVTTDDYVIYGARSILIATGLQYRRLEAIGISNLLGHGVTYGMPVGAIPKNKTCNVVVVGGANSAGQAVLKLAMNKSMKIHLVIRKTIETQMSTYLIRRIKKCENIKIYEGSEVLECYQQKHRLHSVRVGTKNENFIVHADFMFIFIGATPKTLWIRGMIELDEQNYIKTGDRHLEGAGSMFRLPYETNIKGIFAAGDVRSGSVKRIAASSGEGSSAIPYVHRYLAGV